MSSSEVILSVINEDQFSGLREEWNGLLGRSSVDNVFLTWEFCHTWWQAFQENKELLIIVAYCGEDLVGIAPLYRTRSRRFGLWARYHLEFICGTETFFEGLDFILSPERETELLSIFIGYLYSDKVPRWDVLNLTSYRETSKILPQLISLLEARSRKYEIYGVRGCVVVNFPDTFAEYISTLSKNTRKRLFYYRNRIFKLPETYYECLDSSSGIEIAYNNFIKLHQLRQEAKGNEGSFRDSRKNYLKFHDSLVKTLVPLEWILISFVRSRDKFISGRYSYIYNGTLYDYAYGFDPEWSCYSPGHVLTLNTFEHILSNTTVRRCDFLRGISDNKLKWSKNIVKSNDIAIWRDSGTYILSNVERKFRAAVSAMLPRSLALRLYERFIGQGNT